MYFKSTIDVCLKHRRFFSSLKLKDLLKNGQGKVILGGEYTDELEKLIQNSREQLNNLGYAHIPAFIHREQVQKVFIEELQNLMKINNGSFYSKEAHTVYQEQHDKAYEKDHPRNILQSSSKIIIDYDRIKNASSSSPIDIMYNSEEFISFLSNVLNTSNPLYKSACKYNAAYYNIFHKADGLGWHFGRSDFGVALELQLASFSKNHQKDGGGHFEIDFGTRTAEDPWSFERVEKVLNRDVNERINVPTSVIPGSLVIFQGNLNLHRVTEVTGDIPRINCIMTYERKPNQKPNEYSLRKFFGR